ncbi:MAG: chorismate synthase [Candidatus Omnitrophota bacterium]
MRILTAGESHGRGLVAIIDGMPAGLKVKTDFINEELRRRQMGFGRGKRMQIENDKAQIISGLKGGVTLGSPISLLIENKDCSIETLHKVVSPRPGHADLAGFLKYGFSDIREVLERASARSTAATVGCGAIAKLFLREFKIDIGSMVVSIGGEVSHEAKMDKIREALEKNDTVGGVFEIRAAGVPVGLGSYVQPDRRLDSKLAAALMAIPGVKGVEVGLGFGYAQRFGSEVHDPIYYEKRKGIVRTTNNAGGIEGGISNGEDIVIRACMKPIATLLKPLDSINISSRRKAKAAVERSDICAVESAGVVGEAAVAQALADAFLEKFGSDNMADIKAAVAHYLSRIK